MADSSEFQPLAGVRVRQDADAVLALIEYKPEEISALRERGVV